MSASETADFHWHLARADRERRAKGGGAPRHWRWRVCFPKQQPYMHASVVATLSGTHSFPHVVTSFCLSACVTAFPSLRDLLRSFLGLSEPRSPERDGCCGIVLICRGLPGVGKRAGQDETQSCLQALIG